MKVLLVEDDIELCSAIKKGLTLAGYAVDARLTGADGLAAAYAEAYDVIVLDWTLPDISGYDVCKQLRLQNSTSSILFLTALGDLTHRIAGLDAGADDYLCKPFDFEELLARLRALCRRTPSVAPCVLSVRDLDLDTNGRSASRCGQQIRLTRKEYALLHLLMSNPGYVFSSSDILRRIWDENAETLPSSVATYISYLRTKIEKPFQKLPRLIHTAWGQGWYMQ